MERNLQDKLTHFFKDALDTILLAHPVRSALGILCGTGLYICTKILTPFLVRFKNFELSRLDLWEFLVIGLIILHIQTIFSVIIRRASFDENTEQALRLIREAQEAGLSTWQVKQLYKNLCEKALEKVELDAKTKKEVEKIEKIVAEKSDK